MRCFLVAISAALVVCPAIAWGQRVRFPTSTETPDNTAVAAAPSTGSWTASGSGSAPSAAVGLAPVSPIAPSASASPSAGTLLAQAPPFGATFDPYAPATSPLFSSPPSGSPPVFGTPTVAPPPGMPPPPPQFSTVPGQPLYGAPPAQPYYGQPFPGTQPQAVFPNGIAPNWNWGSGWGVASGPPYQRLFQNTGIIYTWLADGDSPRDLEINEVEISTTAYFPNFFHTQQPLLVTPGFVFDFLDGPAPPLPGSALTENPQLPPVLYAAYLDFAWAPHITPQFGIEADFRVGVYTDFDTLTTDSLRFTGTGLGVLHLTPAVTLKLGATYLDRLRIKILPAGGILWKPNPQTVFDIYFPSPKLAQYLTTIGTTELWWYVGGEYGGGSWTFGHEARPIADGPPFVEYSEQVDINDIRLYIGIDWKRQSSLKGFLEVGWVFDREVLYDVVPADNFRPSDAFMLRAGIAF